MNTGSIWALLDKHFDTSLLSDLQIEEIDGEIETLVHKGQYVELTELGTKYNGPRKKFLEHYEERYKYLKTKIIVNGTEMKPVEDRKESR